jgi:hypothetical protein
MTVLRNTVVLRNIWLWWQKREPPWQKLKLKHRSWSIEPVPRGPCSASQIARVTACNEWPEERICVLQWNILQTCLPVKHDSLISSGYEPKALLPSSSVMHVQGSTVKIGVTFVCTVSLYWADKNVISWVVCCHWWFRFWEICLMSQPSFMSLIRKLTPDTYGPQSSGWIQIVTTNEDRKKKKRDDKIYWVLMVRHIFR